MEKAPPTKETPSGWLMVLAGVVRTETGAFSVTIVSKWQGVRRYAASFRKSKRSGDHLKPYNKQRFTELGDPESSGIFIPKSPYNDMESWAAAIIFEKR